MTLAEFASWRRREAARADKRPEGHTEALLAELTSAALTARRAGVVPSLGDLAESREVETAWLTAGAIYAEEQALGAKGLTPEIALERLHDSQTEQLKRELAAKRGAA